jgi:hypothetical protein
MSLMAWTTPLTRYNGDLIGVCSETGGVLTDFGVTAQPTR